MIIYIHVHNSKQCVHDNITYTCNTSRKHTYMEMRGVWYIMRSEKGSTLVLSLHIKTPDIHVVLVSCVPRCIHSHLVTRIRAHSLYLTFPLIQSHFSHFLHSVLYMYAINYPSCFLHTELGAHLLIRLSFAYPLLA